MEDLQERLCEVHKKRSSILILIVACFVFMLLGAFLIKNSEMVSLACTYNEFRRFCFSNPETISMIGQSIFGYFGVCLIILGVSILRPICIFYCTEQAFWSQKYGDVEWQNIKDVYPDNSSGQTIICYKTKDSDKEYSLKFEGSDTDVMEIFKLIKTNCKYE